MPGRFQVFGWDDDPRQELRWRLISENGRQLATSPGSFPGFGAAVDAALAARLAAPDGVVVVTSTVRVGWTWSLRPRGAEAESAAVAVAARRYARRVELTDAIARFRALAAVAEVSAAPVVFRRSAAPGRAVGT